MKTLVPAALTVGLLMGSIPMAAHHGTNISYDREKEFTVTATVTEFRFTSPHPQLYLDIVGEDGALTARGRSLEGRVTAKRGRILGGDDVAMLIHCEESTTTNTAPFRRNPLGAGGFGPQALSFVGHDEKTSFRSSLRACNLKTPARGPRDFCHGLLTHWSAEIAANFPALILRGWTRARSTEALIPGTRITVTLAPSRAGTPSALVRRIVGGDGEEILGAN